MNKSIIGTLISRVNIKEQDKLNISTSWAKKEKVKKFNTSIIIENPSIKSNLQRLLAEK